MGTTSAKKEFKGSAVIKAAMTGRALHISVTLPISVHIFGITLCYKIQN